MTADFALHALLGLLPVMCFLGALVYLDSYKLVRVRWILATIAIGGILAASSHLIHTSVLDATQMEYTQYVRYVSPPIEEALKGLIIVALLHLNRIGFLVDAAIFGFAAGAGFSMIENLYYLQSLAESHIGKSRSLQLVP